MGLILSTSSMCFLTPIMWSAYIQHRQQLTISEGSQSCGLHTYGIAYSCPLVKGARSLCLHSFPRAVQKNGEGVSRFICVIITGRMIQGKIWIRFRLQTRPTSVMSCALCLADWRMKLAFGCIHTESFLYCCAEVWPSLFVLYTAFNRLSPP